MAPAPQPPPHGRRPWLRLTRALATTAVVLVIPLAGAPATAQAGSLVGSIARPPAVAQAVTLPDSAAPDPSGGGDISLTPQPPSGPGSEKAAAQDENAVGRRWLVIEQLLVTALLVTVAVVLGRRSPVLRTPRHRAPRGGQASR